MENNSPERIAENVIQALNSLERIAGVNGGILFPKSGGIVFPT